MKPGLIVIGPDKCGTDWLHLSLTRQPEISVATSKELFFFDRHFDKGWAWYLKAGKIDTTVPWAEVCHGYLFSPLAAQRIGDVAEVKAAVIVRNPIDRAFSAYNYLQYQGRISPSTTFETALAIHHELISHGLYGANLAPFQAYLGRDRLVLIDFDDLSAKPSALLHDLMLELGIDSVPNVPESVANPSRRARFPRLVGVGRLALSAMRAVGAHEMASSLKSRGKSNSLLNVSLGDRPDHPTAPSSATSEALAAVFKPDLATVDREFGTNFVERWFE